MLPGSTQRWRHRLAIVLLVTVPFGGGVTAIRLLWQHAVGWSDLALLVGLYLPASLGITVGFHRYLTHRGFRTSRPIAALLLVLGSLAVEGPALTWAATHRKHHALADQAGDPHSPQDGFFHAHIGWLFDNTHVDELVYARDLLGDRLVVVISRLFPVWVVLSLAIPFALGGWHGLIWGGLVRILLTHHITWSVNSVCHSFGSRPFGTKDRSRNEWVVGLLALGEGWHNNHHAFPRSALHGLRWWQLDLSGLAIRGAARLGLVWEVQRVSRLELRTRLARGMPKEVGSW